MTLIDEESPVVYQVAICESPVLVGEDDDRTDDELIAEAENRTTVDGMEFPDWTVFTSDPPDGETFRYTDTKTRINVRAIYGEVNGSHLEERDVFDEIDQRVDIEDLDPDMSHWGATHEDDFDGKIHLDLTDQ